MKYVIFCALAALCVPAAADAGAIRPIAGLHDAWETTVNYSDLDLDRPAGADMMLGRLRRAAAQVCGVPSPRELGGVATLQRDCVAAAIQDALRRLDAPMVTARYYSKDTPALAGR